MTWLERLQREAAHAGPVFIQAPQGAPSEPGESVGAWVEGFCSFQGWAGPSMLPAHLPANFAWALRPQICGVDTGLGSRSPEFTFCSFSIVLLLGHHSPETPKEGVSVGCLRAEFGIMVTWSKHSCQWLLGNACPSEWMPKGSCMGRKV